MDKKGVIGAKIDIYTDASNFAMGIKIESEIMEINIPFKENNSLSNMPIHLKEAHAVWYVVHYFGKKFKNRKIQFLNDNMAVVSTFEHGCSDPRLSEYIRKIHEEAHNYNIALAMEWDGGLTRLGYWEFHREWT